MEPAPGVPAGKLAGRKRRSSRVMNSTISFLSQMWLPEVMTSTPWSRKALAIGGVTPKPAAAFSTFTTARSIRYWSRSRGRSLARAARPGSPNTSPTMRMFMSLRDFDGSGLPDDDDLDVTRVLHLGLDALGDVLGELMGVEVGHDVGARHHPQ